MIENIIECSQLTKHYHKHCALDHLDLKIAKGEIFGLIGQNGAGKSTLMKMLAGLTHPSEGTFKLFGNHPEQDPYVYRRIGALIEQPGIYGNMNAMSNMHIKALSMGCDETKELIELLKLCGLDPKSKKKVKSYSLGMKQRLGLAMAMIGNPELLILDEPVNGLDPQGIMDIRTALLKINHERNVTILLSSHILEELSKMATSYGIIKDGVLMQQMSRDELENSCKDYCLIHVHDVKKALVILEEKGHVKQYQVIENGIIHVYDEIDTSMINEMLVKSDVPVYEIGMHKQNLESYFLNLVGGASHVE